MYVAKVTIDHTKIPTDLTDFVVYINLADLPADFWNTVANGGGDIRVYKSDGTTELAREVKSCDTSTDTGDLYLKFTGTLSSTVDTLIQIHADGSSGDYAVTDTYGRNAVWSNYKAVYHLADVNDATVNANTLTNNNTVPFTADLVGKGADYGSSNTNKSLTRNSNQGFATTGHKVFSTVIRLNTEIASGAYSILQYSKDGGIGSGLRINVNYEYNGGTRRLYMFLYDRYDNAPIGTYNITLGTADKYHIAMKYNGTTMKLFVNGVERISFSVSQTYRDAGGYGNWFSIGVDKNTAYTSNYSSLDQDETRMAEADISADWITAEYNNLVDTSNFYLAEALAVNVSVDATVQTATFSTPTPAITGGAIVSQGTPPVATFSTPAPEISGASNVTASVLTAVFSIPAVNIITPDSMIDASVLTATFTTPAPTVQIDSSVTVGVQDIVLSIPASSVQIDASVAVNAQVATFSIPAPTIIEESNITVSPDALVATFSTAEVTVTAEQNAICEPSALTAVFSTPEVTVTAERHISVDVNALTATFSINQPTKVVGLWTAQGRNLGVWTPQGRVI